jgi:competence protein ComEC
LKIGHHGSQTSTSYPFLAAVSPEVGVISAGLTNSFGHPHQEVLDRLAAADVEVWLTDTTEAADTVTLISDCTTYSLSQPGD